MDSERIFRTAVFGGFKRDDVLRYVEDLKGRIVELTEELKGKTVQMKTLQERVDTLSAECEAAKATEERFTKTVDALKTAYTENARLQAENNALGERLLALDQERTKLEQKAQEIKASEAQLGLAFLDARKYADGIVAAANKKAAELQNEASAGIAKQADEVAHLSEDVDALAETLTSSIGALHAAISTLSAKLSGAAQSLANQKEAESFAPDVSVKVEDSPSSPPQETEKNDDSGLTLLRAEH